VTDLKTANQMLAEAIAALESPEHDADVSEAEAIRERLLDLDAAIGERIQAKLDAHRLIIDQWGVSEIVAPRKLEEADEPIVVIEDPLAACDADAWDARLAAIDADAGKAAGKYQDWLAQQKTKLYVQDTNAAPTAVEWEAHREEHASEYSLTGDEVPDPVLESGVAEMPHSELESA
jgi:spore coat polysaccharide biosynthesis predicted glycosyltransferase SpsG